MGTMRPSTGAPLVNIPEERSIVSDTDSDGMVESMTSSSGANGVHNLTTSSSVASMIACSAARISSGTPAFGVDDSGLPNSPAGHAHFPVPCQQQQSWDEDDLKVDLQQHQHHPGGRSCDDDLQHIAPGGSNSHMISSRSKRGRHHRMLHNNGSSSSANNIKISSSTKHLGGNCIHHEGDDSTSRISGGCPNNGNREKQEGRSLCATILIAFCVSFVVLCCGGAGAIFVCDRYFDWNLNMCPRDEGHTKHGSNPLRTSTQWIKPVSARADIASTVSDPLLETETHLQGFGNGEDKTPTEKKREVRAGTKVEQGAEHNQVELLEPATVDVSKSDAAPPRPRSVEDSHHSSQPSTNENDIVRDEQAAEAKFRADFRTFYDKFIAAGMDPSVAAAKALKRFRTEERKHISNEEEVLHSGIVFPRSEIREREESVSHTDQENLPAGLQPHRVGVIPQAGLSADENDAAMLSTDSLLDEDADGSSIQFDFDDSGDVEDEKYTLPLYPKELHKSVMRISSEHELLDDDDEDDDDDPDLSASLQEARSNAELFNTRTEGTRTISPELIPAAGILGESRYAQHAANWNVSFKNRGDGRAKSGGRHSGGDGKSSSFKKSPIVSGKLSIPLSSVQVSQSEIFVPQLNVPIPKDFDLQQPVTLQPLSFVLPTPDTKQHSEDSSMIDTSEGQAAVGSSYTWTPGQAGDTTGPSQVLLQNVGLPLPSESTTSESLLSLREHGAKKMVVIYAYQLYQGGSTEERNKASLSMVSKLRAVYGKGEAGGKKGKMDRKNKKKSSFLKKNPVPSGMDNPSTFSDAYYSKTIQSATESFLSRAVSKSVADIFSATRKMRDFVNFDFSNSHLASVRKKRMSSTFNLLPLGRYTLELTFEHLGTPLQVRLDKKMGGKSIFQILTDVPDQRKLNSQLKRYHLPRGDEGRMIHGVLVQHIKDLNDIKKRRAETPLMMKVNIMTRELAFPEAADVFDDFVNVFVADNTSKGSVDVALGTKILEKYIDLELTPAERAGRLPAIRLPDALPPGGACFGLTISFIGSVLRNGMLANAVDSSRYVSNPDNIVKSQELSGLAPPPPVILEGEEPPKADEANDHMGLLSLPSELDRFRQANLFHRTMQAVFESAIQFDQDRGKGIGFHYGVILNGLGKVLGIDLGAPVTLALENVMLGKQVFGRLPDGLFVFTLGRDGDQHATAVCKSNGKVIWFEPNQGMVIFDLKALEDDEQGVVPAAEASGKTGVLADLRNFLHVYEDMAKIPDKQRHRGKFYPVTGMSPVADIELLELVERANASL